MADDWQVGDLALCVDDGPAKTYGGRPEADPSWLRNLRRGAIYRVSGLVPGRSGDTLGMWDEDRHAGGCVTRFRKIRPHAPDAEDLRTIALLNGNPEPADHPRRDLTEALGINPLDLMAFSIGELLDDGLGEGARAHGGEGVGA